MFIKAVFLANLVAIVLAQTPMPASTCYKGPGAGPAFDCNRFINKFCGLVNPEHLRLHDNNARYYNLPNGNRCDFIAYNSRQDNASPSGPYCGSVLENITKTCSFGGFGQCGVGGYTFTVDVNAGPCTSSVQPGS
ncbi:hypothetical protein P691DRAFT_765887 [Macrolepiota fuliginosa MF-IS2]|uniref:Glycan binding protein Y3-like domain-containing protein n=1 Tax=Macrolepiota fuliginosa MF-IS2 TaxID=1400762 RepID=A0A9P5X1M2_9AGAR|nr:hypothetical protein P691DRAFT_765887 [Macrolepiota fuliginosa MF-IS2]